MRPDNFAQIVAAQGGGGDGGIANIANAVTGGGSGATAAVPAPPQRQGFLANFNPFDYGLIGLARAILAPLGGAGSSGAGESQSVSSRAPQPKPSVFQRDNQLFATRDMPRFGFTAGQSAPVPDYPGFSFRGLTSTDPGNVMRNIMGAERNMAATAGMDSGGDGTAPTSPVSPAPTSSTEMPGERPPWWPSYLPWPPAPNVSVPQAAPAPTVPPMGTQPTGSLPAPTPYGTSYSNLQSAISGAQNPLMMGIGGMLRRP